MYENSRIVNEVSEYIRGLFVSKMSKAYVYHDLSHTLEVVDGVREIGLASKLNTVDLELVTIAGYFHDIGYIEGRANHEERSAEYAAAFLRERDYAPERIEKIKACIRATRIPQHPASLLEEILCDADLLHLGKKTVLEKGLLLREEWERTEKRVYSEIDWLKNSIDFHISHRFYTEYARDEYGERHDKNLRKLQKRLDALLEGQAAAPVPPVDAPVEISQPKPEKTGKIPKTPKPLRGVETMFRVSSRNHVQFSSIADNKANSLIHINSLVLSLTFSLIVPQFSTQPFLLVPTAMLGLVCLTTIVFAVLTTRPKVTTDTFSPEEVQQKKVNLLFFGNFYKMSLEQYEAGVRMLMNDGEYLYGSLIKDLYFLGVVLAKKYHYLRIAYNVFMFGLIATVLAFGLAFLLAH